jgi:hypothetical protein
MWFCGYLIKETSFPTVRYDGFQNVRALAEWFTFIENELSENYLWYTQSTMRGKRKQLRCWSVKTVIFHPWHSCWISSQKIYVSQS